MRTTQYLRAKFETARALLADSTTTVGRLRSLATLLQGVDPKVDRYLKECAKYLRTLGKLEDGAVIELSAEQLPEGTPEEKKRKKALLLFIRSWQSLRAEVARVEAAFESRKEGASQAGMWASIFSAMKGPLGLITIVAIAVAALHTTAVDVTITNNGCSTLYPSGSLPPLPGLSLPKEPIPDGASSMATLPPLTFTVDGSTSGTLTFSSLKFDFSIELSSDVEDVIFDGASLLGEVSTVKLSDAKEHTLVIECR